MKKTKCVFVAAILGVLTGCATYPVTTGNSAESGGDGIIRQKMEFRDLPADMQEAIMHGG